MKEFDNGENWIPQTKIHKQKKRKTANGSGTKVQEKNIHTRETRRLKYCTKCCYVWENYYCISGRATKIFKYKELSSYKLTRQICASCERKRNGDTNSNRRIKKMETQYC